MFENVSQALFHSGGYLYLIGIPLLRTVATLLMVIAIWRKLKKREDDHKLRWMFFTFCSPVLSMLFYEAYCHWINPKITKRIKHNFVLYFISVVSFALSVILTVTSFGLMGVGFLKSKIDNEPLVTYYDLKGNTYDYIYDIPLYDKNGNKYLIQNEWFTYSYLDQNGKIINDENCFIGEDGYFYCDIGDKLKPCQSDSENDFYGYYTDGEMVFYDLHNLIYWDENGTIWEKSGRMNLVLFDFE